MSIFKRKIGTEEYAGWSSATNRELKTIQDQIKGLPEQVHSFELQLNEFLVALNGAQGKSREAVLPTLPLRAEKLDVLARHITTMLDLVLQETEHAARREKLSVAQRAYAKAQREIEERKGFSVKA
ncbi:TPA: hypothetical protein HA241_07700 [Candidatus Woesearchaeota archaeon]|nr:hypothetical protein [Candidatus Woesearchaeota archaeon]